ncbi:MAG TPA: transposase, partial [Roseiflexaceae bacterium]
MRTIRTTYRYRLESTKQQAARMRRFAGARRWVWNWALHRKKAHYAETKTSLTYNALAVELTELKRQPETAWLREVDSQALQQVLRDLDQAFSAFFAKRVGYPMFKSKKTDTPRFRIPQRVVMEGVFVRVPKIGLIRARIHRPVEGEMKSATFKQEPDGSWYVCFVVAQLAPDRQSRPIRTRVGVDLGLHTFAMLSNGNTIDNPRFYRKQMRKLAHAQRALARKQKGSKNRDKARVQVARLHQKVKHQRQDFAHKVTTDLVRQFDLISLEDLSIRGLARTKLSTSVLDASWSMFRRFLAYKADWMDRHIMVIGRFYPSSRLCPACGAINGDLTLADRVWTCGCGAVHHRDLNAARNIDHEGFRLFEQLAAVGHTEA